MQVVSLDIAEARKVPRSGRANSLACGQSRQSKRRYNIEGAIVMVGLRVAPNRVEAGVDKVPFS